MRRSLVPGALAALLLLAAALPAPATAKPRPRDLWATINVCDTAAQPNRMGVRARMPGNGTHQRMYMRFRAHYFGDDGKWHNVGGSGRSGWILLGSARVRYREAGYTFSFGQPAAGGRYVLRGLVEFRWREKRWVGRRTKRVRRAGKVRRVVVKRGKRRWVTVRTVRANTKGGFESTAGADPPGFSAGLCEIR